MVNISTGIRRHRHAGSSHPLHTSSIGMILSVEALEVKQKTLLVNLVQLKAHLHLDKAQTQSTILHYCTKVSAALDCLPLATELFWCLEQPAKHISTPLRGCLQIMSEDPSFLHLLSHLLLCTVSTQ